MKFFKIKNKARYFRNYRDNYDIMYPPYMRYSKYDIILFNLRWYQNLQNPL